jgi:DNA invertase Pin-like site-specific DNA recombinase
MRKLWKGAKKVGKRIGGGIKKLVKSDAVKNMAKQAAMKYGGSKAAALVDKGFDIGRGIVNKDLKGVAKQVGEVVDSGGFGWKS